MRARLWAQWISPIWRASRLATGQVVREVLTPVPPAGEAWAGSLDAGRRGWRDVVHTIKGAARGVGANPWGTSAPGPRREGPGLGGGAGGARRGGGRHFGLSGGARPGPPSVSLRPAVRPGDRCCVPRWRGAGRSRSRRREARAVDAAGAHASDLLVRTAKPVSCRTCRCWATAVRVIQGVGQAGDRLGAECQPAADDRAVRVGCPGPGKTRSMSAGGHAGSSLHGLGEAREADPAPRCASAAVGPRRRRPCGYELQLGALAVGLMVISAVEIRWSPMVMVVVVTMRLLWTMSGAASLVMRSPGMGVLVFLLVAVALGAADAEVGLEAVDLVVGMFCVPAALLGGVAER